MKILLVDIDKSFGETTVSVTENGWQYNVVYTGTAQKAKVIAEAFYKIGYKSNKFYEEPTKLSKPKTD